LNEGRLSAGAEPMPLPLFALFAASFSVGTAELVISGLLPTLATDLGVTIPVAGLLISGYAVGVAIGGPLLALATGRVPRRLLLLAMMSVFVIGNGLCALAASYGFLMGARLVVACSHGLFFGVAMIVATGLVPKERQATAVSLVVAGITFANVVGVPIGTAIGNTYGWRATFWAIMCLGIVATLALALLVPNSKRPEGVPRASATEELRAVMQAPVLVSYLIITLAMVGAMSQVAYIVPMLTEVTKVPITLIPWLLFVAGVGGIFGNLAGGRLGDWKPLPALIGVFSLQAALYLVALVAIYQPVMMTIVLFFWWLVGFSFAAPVQTRVLTAARAAPNLAATLISTAINIGIAAGAGLGGLALTWGWGYARLPLIGAVFMVAALAVTLILYRMDRRR
jgi:DHA1 family inner membrane transport protein